MSDAEVSNSEHSSKLSPNKRPSQISKKERESYSDIPSSEEGPSHVPGKTIMTVINKGGASSYIPRNEASNEENSDKNSIQKSKESVDVPIELIIDKIEREVISNNDPDHRTHGCLHMYEKHPCIIIIMVLVLSISCAVWVLATNQIKYSPPNERDFLVRNKYTTKLFDAVWLAQTAVYNMQSTPVRKQAQVNDEWTTHLLVVSKVGKTVFSQENIKLIRRIADQLRSMDGIEQYCLKDKTPSILSGSTCSPIEFMRGVVFSFGDDMEDDDVQNKLKDLLSFPENRAYLIKDITLTNTYSNITRVIYKFAMPISTSNSDFIDRYDRAEEQEDQFKQFSLKMKSFVDSVEDPELKFYLYSDALYEYIYIDSITDDSEFLSYSLIFLFCYLWFRCKSFFLAITGFFQVLLSFPIAFMLYKPLFGINYIGVVHIIAVYIGLVVSFENIIIFIGNWRHSKRYKDHRKFLRYRMYYTVQKSFGAITSSSIVTAIAFVSTGFCEIIPISSFGFAMALIIFVNYVLLYTYFPCVLLFYWKYLRKLCDCIDWIRKLVNPRDEKYKMARKKSLAYKGQLSDSDELHSSSGKNVMYRRSSVTGSVDAKPIPNPRLGALEYCLENCYAVTIYKMSIAFIVALVILLIVMIYLATLIPGVSKPEQLLPDSFDIWSSRELVKEAFGYGEGDDNIVVRFVYGIQEVDSSDIEFYDSDNLGKIVWDPKFNMAAQASQKHLIDTCWLLKNVFFGLSHDYEGC